MKKRNYRDFSSIQYRDCFTDQEIIDYKTGNLSSEKRQEIFHHLNIQKCSRCHELYLVLLPKQAGSEFHIDHSSLPEPKLSTFVRSLYEAPEKLAVGQIWTTDPEPRNKNGQVLGSVSRSMPVMIVKTEEVDSSFEMVIRVLPLSMDIEFHLEPWTYFLKENSSPLGYSVLIEIFNERPMLARNLKEYRGEIAAGELQAIKDLRTQFLSSQPTLQDKEISIWQEKEIELSDFLTLPVNAMLWPEDEDQEETIIEDERDIELIEYAKAADTIGIYLGEIDLSVLVEKEDFSLTFVQKRDQVVLEFLSDAEILEDISLNKKKGQIVHKEGGLREINLGHVDQLPTYLDVEFAVNNVVYRFHLRFYRKNE